MEIRIRHRIAVVAVVVCAAATLTAPALTARPDDRAGMLGPGAVAALQSPSFSPDDRGTPRGPGALAAPVRPDDRVGIRGPGAIEVGLLLGAAAEDGGFEWTAAALGAVLVVVLGVLGTLLIVNGRRFERRPV
jgi:hypothetical protein